MSLTDDLLDAARTAARHGGWRLVHNTAADVSVIVPIGRPHPNGLESRRLVWLAMGGRYEYTTMTSDTVWLPTVWVGCDVVVELGDKPDDADVVAFLLESVVTAVKGCALAAGDPEGRIPADNLVVLSGDVQTNVQSHPPALVDAPGAAEKRWQRHRYQIGLGVIAARCADVRETSGGIPQGAMG